MYLKRFSNSHFVYAFIIIAIITYHFYPHALNRWLLYLAVWWTGRDIAILYNTGRKISFRNLAIPLATILTGAMIMKLSVYTHGSTELSDFLNIEYSNLLRIFFVLIIAILWHKTGWIYYKYTLAPFKILAPISYGIYISHMGLIVQASYLDFIDNVYIRYMLYLAVCLGFSYFIERILYMKINKRIMKKIYKA